MDASAFIRRVEDGSTHSSPSSAATSNSPHIPLVNRPSSRGSESADLDEDKEPASGPDRARSASSAKSDREKRKRSRVTPEQLVHLECFFSVDRSPTAARRREISELLGMQERQTQIWFQNRWAGSYIDFAPMLIAQFQACQSQIARRKAQGPKWQRRDTSRYATRAYYGL